MKLFVTLVFLLESLLCHTVVAAPLSGTVSYKYFKAAGQERQLTPDVTLNLTTPLAKNLVFSGTVESNRTNNQPATNTINATYVEYQNAGNSVIWGKQGYALNNGLVASISGVNGLEVNLTLHNHPLTFFYEKPPLRITAGSYTLVNAAGPRQLTVSAGYFQDETRYWGMLISENPSKNTSVSLETSQNLQSNAWGYLATFSCGSLEQVGDTSFSLSYRHIQPDAVSIYCTDSNYIDSHGFRLSFNWQIGKSTQLSTYQDIAENHLHENLAETNIQIIRNF